MDDSWGFTVIPMIVGLVFLFAVVKAIAGWSRNNAAPVETVRSCVVARDITGGAL